jgi:hypothetical protein
MNNVIERMSSSFKNSQNKIITRGYISMLSCVQFLSPPTTINLHFNGGLVVSKAIATSTLGGSTSKYLHAA